MKLSIVIPVYNESASIERVLEKVHSAYLPYDFEKEIVIVDDGSTDTTTDILKRYTDQHTVLFRRENGGKGRALKDGFGVATGDYILIQDADFEYDTSDYVRLLQPVVDRRAHVVFGSRILGKNNVAFSRVYFYGGVLLTKIFNICFKSSLTDTTTCYKLFPKSYVDYVIAMPSDDFVFDAVDLPYLFSRHTQIHEVPIWYKARTEREGKKLNWRHGVKSFWRILILFLKEKKEQLFTFER